MDNIDDLLMTGPGDSSDLFALLELESINNSGQIQNLQSLLCNVSANSSSLERHDGLPSGSVGSGVQLFRIIFDLYLVGLICLVGFIGNALTVAVLRLDKDKTNSTTWLLQALAAVDTAYLAACLVIQPLKIAHELYGVLSRSFPVIERYVWPLAATAQTATVWIVLLVTGDRYVAVCRPFQARWRSVERTRFAVIVVVVLAVLYNLPQWFEREVVWEIDKCTGLPTEIALIKKTALSSHRIYFVVYKTACHLVFRTVGPLLVLTVLNCCLAQSLRDVKRRRQRITGGGAVGGATSAVQRKSATSTAAAAVTGKRAGRGGAGKQRENITTMVVAVIFVFIVCELPDVALRLAVTAVGLEGDGKARSAMQLPPSVVVAANSITNALLALNSAVNFAIYCLVGNKFRRILRRRVLRCGRSSAADDTATTAVLKTVAAVPVAPAVVGSSKGESPLVGNASETGADGAAYCRKDVASSRNENHVVVVVVSAANAAADTACSSPTTPSAVEELTAILR